MLDRFCKASGLKVNELKSKILGHLGLPAAKKMSITNIVGSCLPLTLEGTWASLSSNEESQRMILASLIGSSPCLRIGSVNFSIVRVYHACSIGSFSDIGLLHESDLVFPSVCDSLDSDGEEFHLEGQRW